jgi:transcriptional regulator with XRE-family HTH domain
MNLSDQKFLRALGERLRDRRVALKRTQQELARRCDLHRTFVGPVERGERNVSVLNLRLIARVLRAPLSGLLDGLA